jgi:two-component system, chemotaxis family, CheB/CheR fusion protein
MTCALEVVSKDNIARKSTNLATPTNNSSEPYRLPTRIVGLGASAGGLEPLEQFLAQVPVPSGLAYVVVQHLDPTHKAMLTELLQRATSMPVREVTTYMRVEPNAVYVIPPNTELTVKGGVLRLAEPSEPRGMRLPIDVLFCSLAGDQGARAIGIVLSGMGSDGTLGLQAIKTQGGLTLVQEPGSAQFDSMPKSAIAAGAADVVGLVSDLPQRILLITGARAGAPGPVHGAGEAAAGELGPILELLRAHSKHDLTLYKPSTLRRRIERRMAIHGVKSMAEYLAFLRANPLELDLLFNELLIGVTSFFRDPEVWDELSTVVLPELFAGTEPNRRFRAWVAGCSTGEEAFSLAMVFTENRERLAGPAAPTLQIFATDLNSDAIAFARRGRYPASIAADISAERLARFFSIQGSGYLIDSRIRDMVLFAQHDVIMDPPFTRLDLLSCRNLLIYFNATLQKRILPLFHYCLLPGGVLMLGGSETVGSAHNLFPQLSSKLRLYRRGPGTVAFGAVDFPVPRRFSARAPAPDSPMTQQTPPPTANLQALAEHLLMEKYSPAAVLVNRLGDILYISGHTGQYLEPAAGKANWNIHVMARPAIRAQLTVALRQATKERTAIEVHGLRMDGNSTHQLDITVELISEPKALEGLVMVVFREVAVPLPVKSRRNTRSGATDPALSAELMRSQGELKALREAMRASEEERQTAIEELQSTNEELQSANEELTTSKEESQSMNEELQTMNFELQSKLDDLALAQSDMQNLLNSTDIATLFLDKDLNVRRFTEQIKRIINLRDVDIGRPLSDLATTLNYPELDADAKATLRTLAFSEKEISSSDAHWFKVRIMPYRTAGNVIQGAVITFVDITAAKQLESRLRNT